MRKLVLIALAVCMALCLASCGKTISGSPASVVRQCQDLPASESPTIEVTGYAVSYQAGKDSDSCWMVDDPYGTGAHVAVSFEGPVNVPKTRFTVKGTLYGNVTTKDAIHLTHAEIVE